MSSSSQGQVQRDGSNRHGAQQQQHMSGHQHPGPQTPPSDYCSFLAGYNETRRYSVMNLIGKGSYGVVCAAKDNLTGEVVAIKRIQNVFDNVADAHRILREITLLRLLKHPDIVEIKHIMLPTDPNTFKDLYVVFELMESDLHTVIGANDDLTRDHHKVFLYQLLRGLNFMHTNKVLHRDLKPKNILANSNCKLKICDFGLARPCMTSQAPRTPVLWTDYVATRWYRAPELCGCFYGQYDCAVDMWSIGCIFAEVLLGKPLFPGRDAVSQLQLITDLLGKPPQHVIDGIGNVRARNFLQKLPPKEPRPLASKFPDADPLALDLLGRLLSFDTADRPMAETALAHPYFTGLPSAVQQEKVPIAANFAFEQCPRLSETDVRHLIYREALQYHPQVRMAYENQMAAMQRSRHCPVAVDSHIPCHVNPYTLASSGDSVAHQFWVQQQSDSTDSGCSMDGSLDLSGSVPLQAAQTGFPPLSVGPAGPAAQAAAPALWRMPSGPQALPPQALHPNKPSQMASQPQLQQVYGDVQPYPPLGYTAACSFHHHPAVHHPQHHQTQQHHAQSHAQQHYQVGPLGAVAYYRQPQPPLPLPQQHLQQQQQRTTPKYVTGSSVPYPAIPPPCYPSPY